MRLKCSEWKWNELLVIKSYINTYLTRVCARHICDKWQSNRPVAVTRDRIVIVSREKTTLIPTVIGSVFPYWLQTILPPAIRYVIIDSTDGVAAEALLSLSFYLCSWIFLYSPPSMYPDMAGHGRIQTLAPAANGMLLPLLMQTPWARWRVKYFSQACGTNRSPKLIDAL